MLSPNPDYRTLITNSTEGVQIECNTPEQVFVATGSVWEPRMSGSLRTFLESRFGDGIGRTAFQAATNATNFDMIFQSLTFQAWQSSGPIEFNMTFLFDAENDAYTDVVMPMSRLQAMTLPYTTAANGEIMMPPGPSPIDPDRSRVSIRIGRLLYIHSIILKSVQNTFDTRYDSLGQPISGQSEVTFATINTPSRQDLTTFYVMNQGGMNTAYGTRRGLGAGAY